MTTSTKQFKDKPYSVAPRLAPRPTAASAARAARYATNRNLPAPASQSQSPTRPPLSPSMKRKTSVCTKSVHEVDSKAEIKVKQDPETLVESESMFIMQENTDINENAIDTLPAAEETDAFEIRPPMECRNEIILTESTSADYRSRSLPRTPVSRPQTPKSLPSRPLTPRLSSRPTTPVHPAQQHDTPRSRPATPQPASSRPRTPSAPKSSPAKRVMTPVHASPKEDDIVTTYATKQKQFQRMKKDLDLKQQRILEVFDCLRSLRERMSREGVLGSGEGSPPQELVVFNVADWTAEEIAQLCRDAAAASNTDGAVEIVEVAFPIDECALDDLEAKVVGMPTQFADLCLQAFASRQELIDWIKEFLTTVEGNEESMDRITHYNTEGLQLCESLRELKCQADRAVDTVTQISRRICKEQSALLNVGKTLVREVAHLRQELESRAAFANEIREVHAETESTKALEDVRREFEEEKLARQATKDKLSTSESQLRQTRLRVAKLERQLRDSEASIVHLTNTVKAHEDQSRQREVQLEARARKLKESLKTGEVTSSQLVQQRDGLLAEVAELKAHIEAMTVQHKSAVNDLNSQLKEIKFVLEEQCLLTQKEEELKNAAEAALDESRKTIEELNAKNTELENSKPNPELPTEREMDLWAELQATKESLRATEDELTSSKREKIRFLETLTKIAESENKVGMQQKLAAELLSKEEILTKMQTQLRELNKNIKFNEQKVIQYENYVRDLQAHNRAIVTSQETPDGLRYQDLQQEIMNLRLSLLESAHRNEELSELLAQKEQQLEQHDKTSRSQARLIKVREQLINMLKNKETEQTSELCALQQDLEHRMKIVDEVNKQIAAKADEIQELFSTLENKQQQIHRLEKIVLALEEQQRRAQAQRTRHEEKIAALEHELAAGGNRREKKFLFF